MCASSSLFLSPSLPPSLPIFSTFSSSSSQTLCPKNERVTGAKDGSFEATAVSLSGRALNFPRLNRSPAAAATATATATATVVLVVVMVRRGVSSLYFRLHARRGDARFFPSLRIYTTE